MTVEQYNDRIGDMMTRHVSQLSEHLSAIQVVATKVEADGSTTFFNFGSGDLYARAKACEEYLARIRQHTAH